MQRLLVKRGRSATDVWLKTTHGTTTHIAMGGSYQRAAAAGGVQELHSPPSTIHLLTARRNLSSSSGRSFRATNFTPLPMKPGEVIPGLDLYKEQEPPVVLERSEYPEWVADLAKPPPTLGDLRRIPEEEATDRDIVRFLKLERKIQIKKNNQALKGNWRGKKR